MKYFTSNIEFFSFVRINYAFIVFWTRNDELVLQFLVDWVQLESAFYRSSFYRSSVDRRGNKTMWK